MKLQNLGMLRALFCLLNVIIIWILYTRLPTATSFFVAAGGVVIFSFSILRLVHKIVHS